MPIVLVPAWGWALAGVGVPLVIHLWSRRPTAVRRVSSVRFLEAGPSARGLGTTIRDPWRLALRIAALAATAVGLAEPAWHRPGAGTTVALVAPGLGAAATPLVDSLRRSGADIRPISADSADPWRALADADASPDEGPIAVVAPPTTPREAAPRPVMRRPVTWLPVRAPSPAATPAATPSQRASRPTGDRITADAAHAGELRFVRAAIAAAGGLPAGWRAVVGDAIPATSTTDTLLAISPATPAGMIALEPDVDDPLPTAIATVGGAPVRVVRTTFDSAWRALRADERFVALLERTLHHAGADARPANERLSVRQLTPRVAAAAGTAPRRSDLRTPLLLLAALLIVVERWWGGPRA